MKWGAIKNFALIILLVFLSGLVGYQLGVREVKPNWQDGRSRADFSLLWRVWDEVAQKYVDKAKLDSQKMVYGAISGMVAAIGDPYTIFLPPKENQESKEDLNGKFEGIGAQLGVKDKKIVVIAPLSGSPAESAGIKAGDWIIKIDGKESAGLSLPEAVAKIRGMKGTAVTLQILHQNEEKPKEINIVRDTIVLKSVEWKQVGNGLAYLKLSRFGDQTNSQWDQAVTEINGYLATSSAKTKPGVILDLRNNPGGLLSGAVYLAAEFLDSGVIVKQQDYQGNVQTYSVNRRGKLLTVPLAVLINQGTASAGEILAGSLQAAGRSKLVGAQTFGKGSVQETQDLPDGAGLHITTAKWLLSNGIWINGLGLTPDVKIDNDEKQPEKDLQLGKAVEVLSKTKN